MTFAPKTPSLFLFWCCKKLGIRTHPKMVSEMTNSKNDQIIQVVWRDNSATVVSPGHHRGFRPLWRNTRACRRTVEHVSFPATQKIVHCRQFGSQKTQQMHISHCCDPESFVVTGTSCWEATTLPATRPLGIASMGMLFMNFQVQLYSF